MRKISKEVKESIEKIFPKENTLAVIVFGSYGTDRQTRNSDIDIAWVPKKKVPSTEIVKKTEELRKVLDKEVDLKIVSDRYTVELRRAIFEGDTIYESRDFRDYLSEFYFEHSDVIDILDWRDMHGD